MFICLLIVTVNCYYSILWCWGFFHLFVGGVSCENGKFGQFVMGKQSEDTV